MDKIEVTQAIEWARKVASSKPPRYTDASRNAAQYILATRTDATPVAEVEALRGSISIMETALQQIAGTHAERFGMCQTDVEEVPDLSTEEAVSIARNALEATGDSHPPATDVAALVEAAKALVNALDSCVDLTPNVIRRVEQALAPFTKGQNDD